MQFLKKLAKQNIKADPLVPGSATVKTISWICHWKDYLSITNCHLVTDEDQATKMNNKNQGYSGSAITFISLFFCVCGWGGGIQVNIFMSSDFVKLKNSLKTWTPFFFLSALKLVIIIDFT